MDSPSQQGKSKKGNPRRTSGGLREEHVTSGAFLIEFKQPTSPIDMFRRPNVPVALKPAGLMSGSELQAAKDKYRTMERKGFLVTRDTGCLIPHEQYATYQKGAVVKGHQRSFAFFAHWVPKAGVLRNEHGWPMNPEVSHLCHRRGCCRIDHLVAEEKWRNQKRNYCGHGGSCDCGNEVKCIRKYQMEDQADDPAYCSTKEEVLAALAGAPTFKINGPDAHKSRDKSAKRNEAKRKRKTDAHAHATARKQARLGTVAEEGSEVESGDAEEE